MNRRFNATTLAAGALVLAAGTACGGTNANSSPTPPVNPSTSAPASATSSPSPSSPPTRADTAEAHAEAVVRRYITILDHVRQNPRIPLLRLRQVATSTELAADKDLIETERTKGLTQVGGTRVAELKVRSVHFANNPAAGRVPTVTVDICWDVSKADLVDKNGHSVVSSTRPNTGWTRYTVANYRWHANPSDGWRVATGQDLKKSPCAAS